MLFIITCLSNGPGDPSVCAATIAHIQSHINADVKKPVFGICLGSQLLGLAAVCFFVVGFVVFLVP